jgi:hypothetical protein
LSMLGRGPQSGKGTYQKHRKFPRVVVSGTDQPGQLHMSSYACCRRTRRAARSAHIQIYLRSYVKRSAARTPMTPPTHGANLAPIQAGVGSAVMAGIHARAAGPRLRDSQLR